MKLAVVGSRGWLMPSVISKVLDSIYPSEIVTGGANGADTYAQAWATLHCVPVKLFLPDWSKGRKAGPLRNALIVDYADQVIAFWDGKSRGTLSAINLAKKAGKLKAVYTE